MPAASSRAGVAGAVPPRSHLRRRLVASRGKARIALRWPSASRRVLPDYLIIGAQKCGTTFSEAVLAQHPAVVPACTPEVHYFDWNFRYGSGWYRAHFPTRSTRDRVLGREGEFATGEKSPEYLFEPEVPARVSELLPDVKLLVLLRDPVARAWSHYHHRRRRGHEKLTFEEALAHELGQREVISNGGRSYLARGLYAEQLARWLEYFDRDQIHVTISEHMFADPPRVICEMQRFIGLTPAIPPDLRPRGKAAYESMSPALRARLQDVFADDVERLTALLGEAPGWW